MTDTCRVTKAGVGQGTFNEATGQYDNPPARVVVYEGPCRIQVKADINSNVVETTAGEREWTYTTSQLQLPVMNPPEAIGDVGDVDVDHVAEILTAEYDPALVGRLFNIKAPYGKSQAVYRRMRVNEVVA
jgi:hypothetical protein